MKKVFYCLIASTFIWLIVQFPGIGQDLPPAQPDLQVIEPGAYIIPMDIANQSLGLLDAQFLVGFNGFNLSSYGLVYALLEAGVPVKWVIRTGKWKDQVDFVAEVKQIFPTEQSAGSTAFRASAFMVDKASLDNLICEENESLFPDIDTIITNFARQVKVFELLTQVEVDVRYTLTSPPKIMVLKDGGLPDVHTALLKEADIPFDTLSSEAFFTDFSCYTFVSQPHLDVINNPEYIPRLEEYLAAGGNFLAQCISAQVFENEGGFQTTNGIYTDGMFDNIGYQYFNNDMPVMQFEGILPRGIEGSLTNFTLNGSTWKPNIYVALTNQDGEYVASVADVNGALIGGNVYYLSGHEASMESFENFLITVNNNPSAVDFQRLQQLKRLYMNAVFVPGGINIACAGQSVCICPGESVTLGCSDLIENSQISYEWFPAEGLSCSDCPHPLASPDMTTTYTLTVSSPAMSACMQPSEVTVYVMEGPVVEEILEWCDEEGGFYTVSFDIEGGNAEEYEVTGLAGILDGAHFESLPVPSNEIYSATVTDGGACAFEISGQLNCCPATASFVEEMVSYCQNESGSGSITLDLEGEGPFTINYSINGVEQQPLTALESPFIWANSEPGLYELIAVTDANCSTVLTGEVLQLEGHTIPQIDLSDKVIACNSAPFVLDIGWPSTEYLWQDGSQEAVYEVTEPGPYSVTLTNACGEFFESTEVEVQEQLPVVDLGNERLICLDSVVVLDVAQAGAEYLWQDGSNSPVFEVRESGLYSVTVSNECGQNSGSVAINYTSCNLCDVYVPNAFSPDYNGINDVFRPVFGDCLFLGFEFKIFDRWGGLLFSSSDPDQGWDGRVNDRPVGQGVYVYMISYEFSYKGEIIIERLSGDVTLLR